MLVFVAGREAYLERQPVRVYGQVIAAACPAQERASLRVFLCIGGWLGVVGDAVSEVDAQDGHGVGPVVTGAP